MPFQRGQFLGSSLRSFGANISWGVGAPSQLSLSLADDPENGDLFTPVTVGLPVHFQFGSFTFGGLFQRWVKKYSPDGNPVYEVTVVDPREILEGTQLILAGYNGSVGVARNLINVYGWWESGGFGLSSSNDSGMAWNKVRTALQAICNTPAYGPYGGPLSYRGIAYSLDLSQLPATPDVYRLGGPNVSLLDAIAQVCEDGGADFHVDLVGYTIRVRTISRRTEPPLGTIAALVESSPGLVARAEHGVEARNEVSTAFLIGGKQTTLYLTDTIQQFWGYDINGNAITGAAGVKILTDKQGNVLQAVPTEFMTLNATAVADVIGNVNYPCSTLEMSLALASYESWSAYVENYRPDVNQFIVAPFKNMAAPGLQPVKKNDVVNDARQVGLKLAVINQEFFARAMRLYEFVRGTAQEFLGKKFLVGVPFVLQKIDTDTLRVANSHEVADGGYLPEGSSPLGLSNLNADLFKTPDGRFVAFLKYILDPGADISKISASDTVVEGTNLFVKASVSTNYIFNPAPKVVVTISSPVLDDAIDQVGNVPLVAAAALQMNAQQAAPILKGQAGNVGVKIHPAARTPSAAAVPLQSNTLTYGPWSITGSDGKARFEEDPGLTPWNYGGYAAMNAAALSRVSNVLAAMQQGETGTLELAEYPRVSLGETLTSGGPNCTNIDVSIGTNGVTTTYSFRTYTPKFGVFQKAYIEKFKRQSLTTQELRRSLRAQTKENNRNAQAVQAAARTAWAFMKDAPKAVKKESPHDVLVSYTVQDSGVSHPRTGVTTATYEEAVAMVNADDDAQFINTAAMSLAGLVRPFQVMLRPTGVNPGAYGLGSYIPEVTWPDPLFDDVPTSKTLNPWKGQNDIEVSAWGESYEGLHAFRRQPNPSGVRALCLRGPLMVCGWGYSAFSSSFPDLGHQPYGGPGAHTYGGPWDSGYLTSPASWKVGPLDPLWDEVRGCWSVHDILKGVVGDSIPASGLSHGTVSVRGLTYGSGVVLVPAWNWFTEQEVPAGTRVFIQYVPTDHRWYVAPWTTPPAANVPVSSGQKFDVQLTDGSGGFIGRDYFNYNPDTLTLNATTQSVNWKSRQGSGDVGQTFTFNSDLNNSGRTEFKFTRRSTTPHRNTGHLLIEQSATLPTVCDDLYWFEDSLYTGARVEIIGGGNTTLRPSALAGSVRLMGSAVGLEVDWQGYTIIGASGGRVGAFGRTPVLRPTISGSRDGNGALAALLTALGDGAGGMNWFVDGTSAGDAPILSGSAAGGVLSGTYPDPGFAQDMATQTELDAHTSSTTSVHGITDTSDLVYTDDLVATNITFSSAHGSSPANVAAALDAIWVALDGLGAAPW